MTQYRSGSTTWYQWLFPFWGIYQANMINYASNIPIKKERHHLFFIVKGTREYIENYMRRFNNFIWSFSERGNLIVNFFHQVNKNYIVNIEREIKINKKNSMKTVEKRRMTLEYMDLFRINVMASSIIDQWTKTKMYGFTTMGLGKEFYPSLGACN